MKRWKRPLLLCLLLFAALTVWAGAELRVAHVHTIGDELRFSMVGGEDQDAELYAALYGGGKMVHVSRERINLGHGVREHAVAIPNTTFDTAKIILLSVDGSHAPLCPAGIWDWEDKCLLVEASSYNEDINSIQVKVRDSDGVAEVYEINSYTPHGAQEPIRLTREVSAKLAEELPLQVLRYQLTALDTLDLFEIDPGLVTVSGDSRIITEETQSVHYTRGGDTLSFGTEEVGVDADTIFFVTTLGERPRSEVYMGVMPDFHTLAVGAGQTILPGDGAAVRVVLDPAQPKTASVVVLYQSDGRMTEDRYLYVYDYLGTNADGHTHKVIIDGMFEEITVADNTEAVWAEGVYQYGIRSDGLYRLVPKTENVYSGRVSKLNDQAFVLDLGEAGERELWMDSGTVIALIDRADTDVGVTLNKDDIVTVVTTWITGEERVSGIFITERAQDGPLRE